MAKTIQLPAELPQHPIFLDLFTRIGGAGAYSLICLLAWCAQYRPDGDVSDMSPESLARAAGWGPENYLGPVEWLVVLNRVGAVVNPNPEAVFNPSKVVISTALIPRKMQNPKAGLARSCPVTEIVEQYHAALPDLAKVRTLSTKTQAHLRRLWADESERQDVMWWRDLFKHIAERCPFLTGKGGGDRPFFADFTWIVTPANFEKIINGRYDR